TDMPPETIDDYLAQDDRRDIEGTWESSENVTQMVGGKQLAPEQKKYAWVVTGDKVIRADDSGFVQEQFSFQLDPTTSPKTIDLASPRVGSLPGIYHLEGDTLTICPGYDGTRPSDFPEDAQGCWVLRRVSRDPTAVSQRYANALGCFWMVEPWNV